MLQAIDIRKNYGDNEILKGVTVRVDKGEVVAVIGRSGSGKSTLLRCLNHLETIDSGEIRIDGQAMVTTDSNGIARYQKEKDLSHLADLLGHSNINTTRIYTCISGEAQEVKLKNLGLVI